MIISPAPQSTFDDLLLNRPINRIMDEVEQEGRNSVKFFPPSFKPGYWDVICQRGRENYDHVGNKRFRGVIEENLVRYVNAKQKQEKSKIVSEIVDTIRRNAGIGGFVKKDLLSGRWFEVGDKLARDKVGQALRDGIKALRPEQQQQAGIHAQQYAGLGDSLCGVGTNAPADDVSPGNLQALRRQLQLADGAAGGRPAKLQKFDHQSGLTPATSLLYGENPSVYPDLLQQVPGETHALLFGPGFHGTKTELRTGEATEPCLPYCHPSSMGGGPALNMLVSPSANGRAMGGPTCLPDGSASGPSSILNASGPSASSPHSGRGAAEGSFLAAPDVPVSGAAPVMNRSSSMATESEGLSSSSTIGFDMEHAPMVHQIQPRSTVRPAAGQDIMTQLNQTLANDLRVLLANSSQPDIDHLQQQFASPGGQCPWTESDLTPNPVTYPSKANEKDDGDHQKGGT